MEKSSQQKSTLADAPDTGLSESKPSPAVSPVLRRVRTVRLNDAIPAWTDAQRVWLALGVAAVYLLGYTGVWRIGKDSSIYLTIARNVARGQGYFHPSGLEARVNPGLPWLEAGLMNVFGLDALWAPLLVMLLAGLLGLVVAYRLFRLHAGRETAVVVTLLLALNETWYRYAYELLTDIPFALGLLLFLLGYERLISKPDLSESPMKRRDLSRSSSPLKPDLSESPMKCRDLSRSSSPLKPDLSESASEGPDRSSPSPLASGILLVLGLAIMTLFRSVALTFIAALVVTMAWRVVRRRQWGMALAVAALLVLILAVMRWIDPRLTPGQFLVGDQVSAVHLLTHELPHVLWETFTNRLPRMFTEVASEAVVGADLGPIASVPVSLFILVLGLSLFRYRVLWGMAFLAFFVQWLLFDVTDRYFLPLMPLLAFAWWRATLGVQARLPVQWRNAAVAALLLLWLAPNFVQIARYITDQREGGRSNQDRALVSLGRQAVDQLPSDAVVLCASGNEALPLTYFADRRFEVTLWANKREYRRLALHGRLYVLTPSNGSTRAMLKRLHFAPTSPLFQVRVHGSDRPPWAVHPLAHQPRHRP